MQKLIKVGKYSLALYAGIYSQNLIVKYQLKENTIPKSQKFQEIIKEKKLQESIGYQNYRQYSLKIFTENILHRKLKCFDLFGIYVEEQFSKQINNYQDLQEDQKQQFKIFCFFQINHNAQSEDQIVDNGIVNTIIDSLKGQLSATTSDYSPVATVFINFDYHQKLMVGEEYMLEIMVDKIENNRKIFMKALVKDQNQNIYMQSDSLFVKVNWQSQYWEILKFIQQIKAKLLI